MSIIKVSIGKTSRCPGPGKYFKVYVPFPGLRRVRQRRVHGQADPDAKEQVPGAPEDGRAEKERDGRRPGRRRRHQRQQRVHERRRAGYAWNPEANGEILNVWLEKLRYGPIARWRC